MDKRLEYGWDVLGIKHSMYFGRECGSAAIWMFCALLIRCVLVISQISKFVPNGIVFAFPYLIQLLQCKFSFMNDFHPILPVRLAESILGRVSPSRLLVVIPAHFLGSVFGAVLFQSLCPVSYISDMVLLPIHYNGGDGLWTAAFVVELVLVAVYVFALLVLPDLLEVNHLSKLWISLALLPMMFVGAPDLSVTFSPAAVYALWYVHGSASPSPTETGFEFQGEHLAGPIMGAVLAGVICNRYFPDDPSSWRKK